MCAALGTEVRINAAAAQKNTPHFSPCPSLALTYSHRRRHQNFINVPSHGEGDMRGEAGGSSGEGRTTQHYRKLVTKICTKTQAIYVKLFLFCCDPYKHMKDPSTCHDITALENKLSFAATKITFFFLQLGPSAKWPSASLEKSFWSSISPTAEKTPWNHERDKSVLALQLIVYSEKGMRWEVLVVGSLSSL